MSVSVRSRILFFDVILGGYDFVSDVFICYNYYSSCYNFWTAAAVTFLILPSVSLFIQELWNKTLTLKRMLIVILIQPVTIYRALDCFVNPNDQDKKSKYWALKIHEVSYECLMMFSLQIHVIIHKGLPEKNSIFENSMLVGSLLSSVVSMWYGINYQWLHNQFNHEAPTRDRFRLMLNTFLDLAARLLFMVILNAAMHRESLIVFTAFAFCYPVILYIRKDPQIQVTSDIMPAFNPVFHQNSDHTRKPSPETLKNIRIDLKVFYNCLMTILLSIMMIVYFATDIESHCNASRTFCFFYFIPGKKEVIEKCPDCSSKSFWADPVCKPLQITEETAFQIVFPIQFLLLLGSSLEILQYRWYGTTWVDWILEKPTQNISEIENQKNKNIDSDEN